MTRDDLKAMEDIDLVVSYRHAAKNWLTDSDYEQLRTELLRRLAERERLREALNDAVATMLTHLNPIYTVAQLESWKAALTGEK